MKEKKLRKDTKGGVSFLLALYLGAIRRKTLSTAL